MGILKLAFKLLVNDKGKFYALLSGITFSVFLMIQMTSLFSGIINRSSSTVLNVGSTIWVMDPAVKTVANSIGMPDYVLDGIRSIDGVKYAAPLFSGVALVKLKSGNYQPVTVMGLDDASLVGRPELIEGDIESIYAENSFILVKDAEINKLENPKLGTEFELNDNKGVIKGISKVPSSGIFGMPTLYTTYSKALQYLPNPRFTISYILVEPKNSKSIKSIQKKISELGYLALTKDEFIEKIARFYKYETGLGINIFLMTAFSFIIGLSISGQTFYTFIMENIEKFGALKAIGSKSRDLVLMILFQASFTSILGYGFGVGLCVLVITMAKLKIPDYAPMVQFTNLWMAFIMVIIITAISSYAGVRKVLRIDPYDVFRG